MSRVLVHFSCGAASAVAAKVAATHYGPTRAVELIYENLSLDEHADNARFMSDVERWIGQKVIVLSHPKYKTVEDAWRGEKYIVGPAGASCTRVMKRELIERYQRPDDWHVVGFTHDERGRIRDIESFHPQQKYLWLLASAGITKEDCYHILSSVGIELPIMYKLGFNHNNCIGCCKGGKGYWNKVRIHFPEIFWARARVQRELNVGFNSGGELFFLDELGQDEGRDVPEPPIECGVFCSHYSKLIDLAATTTERTSA